MAKEFPLSVIIRAIDRVTGPMRSIQAGLGRFDREVGARFRAVSDRLGIPALTAASRRLGGALGDIGATVGKLAVGFGAMGAVAATVAWQMVTSFVDAGSSINDVSAAIGINAETLQEWRYAAKQNGVEADLLDNSLGILSKNLGKAFKGKGPADLLKGMKISLKGANGEAKTAEQLLPEIADGLARIRNPALRATAAAEFFGKGGVKLIPMLKDGSKGMQEYARRARELGIVLSGAAVAQADNFGDKMDDLKAAFTGLRNIAGTALLPVLTDLIDKLTKFITAHGPSIRAWFDDFAAKLPGRLEELRKGFGQLWDKLKPVSDFVQVLVNTFGGANVTIAAVVGVITALLLPSLVALTSALWAVNVALWANPIGILLAIILAVVAALAYFSLKIEDGRIKLTKFGEAVAFAFRNFSAIGLLLSMGEKFNAILGWWKAKIDSARMAFTELASSINRMIPDWAKRMLSGGGGALSMLGGPIGVALGAASAGQAGSAGQNGQVRVQVDLNGLPPGSRVQSEQKGKPGFELNQGYAY